MLPPSLEAGDYHLSDLGNAQHTQGDLEALNSGELLRDALLTELAEVFGRYGFGLLDNL